jgi:mRNA interferase RelE/StbE
VKIEYKASVERDLRRIGMPWSKRVVDKLEDALGSDPDRGIPLRGEYAGLFKLRVGNYRVIYAKTHVGVLVLRIGHRKHVY